MYLLYKHIKKKRAEKREADAAVAGQGGTQMSQMGQQGNANSQYPVQQQQQYQYPQSQNYAAPNGAPPQQNAYRPPPVAVAQPPKKRRPSLQRLAIYALALCIPIFLETLDYTIVAVAQPQIASVFNALSLQSYIGTVYLLTSTVFLPFFASLAHVYGRHWSLQIAFSFFLIGSVLSTAAQNMPMMLAGRGISGIGAAGLLSVVRIILSDTTSLDENNWQSTLLVALYFPGFIVGPIVGGVLINISFRWIFAINLPCCVLGMAIIFLLLRNRVGGPKPPTRFRKQRPDDKPTQVDRLLQLDWLGTTLFVIGGVLLLLGLNWGSTESWDQAKTIAALVIGPLLLAVCIFWEWLLEKKQDIMVANPEKVQSRTFWLADPMVPLAVFRNYDVCVTEFAAFTSGMIMLVAFYFLSIFFSIVLNQSNERSGTSLLFFAPGLGAGSFIAIRMISWFRQPKYPILLGGAIIPIALGLLSEAVNNLQENKVKGYLAMAGAGVGLTFGPLSIHARFSQPRHRVPIVVALNLFFRSLGGTVGLAQCFAILNAKVTIYLQEHASSIADAGSVGAVTASSLSSVADIDQFPADVQDLIRDAFRYATRLCFISLIPWTALSCLLCIPLSNIRDTDREPLPEDEIGADGMPLSGRGAGVNGANVNGVNGADGYANEGKVGGVQSASVASSPSSVA